MLEAYQSPNAKDVQAQFKEASGLWTGWYTGIFGFISNTSRLNADIGGKKPATWDDLLDPVWKQRLILPDPIKTGGGYIFIATQIFRFGRDETKAMDFMKKLHPNILSYGPTSPGVITSISNGEAAGAPNWSHDILTEKAKDPTRVDLTVPKDTGFEVGAVSIVKGTKNLLGAQAFVAWVLTFALVGGEVAWALRPFVGSVYRPIELLRADALEGNVYEFMRDAAEHVVAGRGRRTGAGGRREPLGPRGRFPDLVEDPRRELRDIAESGDPVARGGPHAVHYLITEISGCVASSVCVKT